MISIVAVDPDCFVTNLEMFKWNINKAVNINENDIEQVMDDKVDMTVGFVRVELNSNDKDIVEQGKDVEVSPIPNNLLQSEHVPPVFSTKAGDGFPAEAFASDKGIDRPAEFWQVGKLEDGDTGADDYG